MNELPPNESEFNWKLMQRVYATMTFVLLTTLFEIRGKFLDLQRHFGVFLFNFAVLLIQRGGIGFVMWPLNASRLQLAHIL